MRGLSLKQLPKEQLAEMSLIELAYELLVEKNEPYLFKELTAEIGVLAGHSKQEVKRRIAQFYTDLNVDGRFTPLGENRWGLKVWYPIDQIAEEVVHAVKPKKKKAKKAAVVVDDFDEVDEEEDEDFIESDDIDDLDDDDDEVEEDLLVDEDLVDDDDDDDDEELAIDEKIIDEDFDLDDDEDEEEIDEVDTEKE
ncbi:DNA-directed RNA polymerase subunit delta [Peribacillus sp. FSL H8-0477]|uniref:DNA-directed RNA polymerase subunit delta n=1 Tax=Peribacillus sp. FSL H8-0477 TaxID=2921388 RepID=UPI0030F63E96